MDDIRIAAATDKGMTVERSQERPLHVRVAEALGCILGEAPKYAWDSWRCRCKPVGKEMIWGPHAAHVFHPCHDGEGLGCDDDLARYDTDWSATGPLIEKYRIVIDPYQRGGWYAGRWESARFVEPCNGETPLIAVCNLILALAAAGKLAKAHKVTAPTAVEPTANPAPAR